MYNLCTISTHSHLFKAYALADSLKKYGAVLHVLVLEGKASNHHHSAIEFYYLDQMKDATGLALINKYKYQKDKLRWGFKPVFLKHLMNKTDSVIYVDNDIYFYEDCAFLFHQLIQNNVLLTPHFYQANPVKNQNWLEANFRVGLYNAGFVGVNNQAIPFLDWWAQCCLYNIKKSFWRGLFDDQKYLDLAPILFDKVQIIKHQGCNIAGWNYHNVNESVVFIHFAELTLIEFAKENNPYFPAYLKYMKSLREYAPNYIFKRKVFNFFTINSYHYFVKWNVYRFFEKLF